MNSNKLSRRSFIQSTSFLAAGTIAGAITHAAGENTPAEDKRIIKNGRIKQSVSRWCYSRIPLEEFCTTIKAMGIMGIDLMRPPDFPTLKKHDILCTMVETHPLATGLNRKENHEQCIAAIRPAIDAAAEYGFPNVVSFSGNSAGMSDEEGVENAVEGLKQIVGYAEEKKVTICLEYLNSKVNHRDYMFDNIKWGVDVCKKVGSERVKILYDIYHAQIMEGDIIRTIRANKDYIGHYHTAGNPGRNEIDESQEIYYPPIIRAIVDTGFTGFVGHEFSPRKDPLTSLAQAVQLCDV